MLEAGAQMAIRMARMAIAMAGETRTEASKIKASAAAPVKAIPLKSP